MNYLHYHNLSDSKLLRCSTWSDDLPSTCKLLKKELIELEIQSSYMQYSPSNWWTQQFITALTQMFTRSAGVFSRLHWVIFSLEAVSLATLSWVISGYTEMKLNLTACAMLPPQGDPSTGCTLSTGSFFIAQVIWILNTTPQSSVPGTDCSNLLESAPTPAGHRLTSGPVVPHASYTSSFTVSWVLLNITGVLHIYN